MTNYYSIPDDENTLTDEKCVEMGICPICHSEDHTDGRCEQAESRQGNN